MVLTCYSIWKPLRGPLTDWPLGVCDVRTVDADKDILEATILHETYVNHNCQVHFNPEQQWYYLRNQEPDELMVFRQFDSRKQGNNGTTYCPHMLDIVLMMTRCASFVF